MHIQSAVENNNIKVRFVHWQAVALITAGFIFSMPMVSCSADEPPAQEHAMDMKGMDMNMDHASHEHAMNHSEHEHHMMAKPGLLAKSMAEYTVPSVKMVGMKGDNVELHKTLNADSPIILNFIFTSELLAKLFLNRSPITFDA